MRLGILIITCLLAGCQGQTTQPVSVTAFKVGPMIEGTVKAPAAMIDASKPALQALRDEQPLAEAIVQLLDPQDRYYRLSGRPITTTVDRQGTFRFQSGFPRNVPTLVAASLTGGERLVGFVVPGDGTTKVDLSVASTICVEFLRHAATKDGKGMETYDRPQLADLIQQKTQPDGLAIVMEASHFCMGWRGVKDVDSKMINSVMRGSFLKDANLRREFLSLIPRKS